LFELCNKGDRLYTGRLELHGKIDFFARSDRADGSLPKVL